MHNPADRLAGVYSACLESFETFQKTHRVVSDKMEACGEHARYRFIAAMILASAVTKGEIKLL